MRIEHLKHVPQAFDIAAHLLKRDHVEPGDNLLDAEQRVQVSLRGIRIACGPFFSQVSEDSQVPRSYQKVSVERLCGDIHVERCCKLCQFVLNILRRGISDTRHKLSFVTSFYPL